MVASKPSARRDEPSASEAPALVEFIVAKLKCTAEQAEHLAREVMREGLPEAPDRSSPGLLYASDSQSVQQLLREAATREWRASLLGPLSEEHFNVLMSAYQGSMFKWAARWVGPELARDIVHDTIVGLAEAYRRYAGFDANHFEALLRVLIRFNAIGHRRKTSRRQKILDRLGLEDIPHDSNAPQAIEFELAEAKEEFKNALDQLPPELREIILTIDVEGLKYEEAARALGVKVNTIRSRLHRARAMLVKLLG